MAVRVDLARCVGCGGCVYSCPMGALQIVDTKCVVGDACVSCGACIDICNWKALSLEEDAPVKETPLNDSNNR